jgi:ADP-heptose:LPS heptosyltransferase
VLVVRLDSMGDMLICGPAIRAVAAGGASVTVLAGPAGAEAARLLPAVQAVLTWDCPWISPDPPPVVRPELDRLIETIRQRRFAEAIVLTSFHQSALPTALLLRLAGIGRIAACSTDYPGALLDVRIPEPAEAPEPIRMVQIVAGAGYPLPAGDAGALAVRADLPEIPVRLPGDYLVVHPGAAAPARSCSPATWAGILAALAGAGWPVVLTGGPAEADTTAWLAGAARRAGSRAESEPAVLDVAGRLNLGQLAAVLRGARAVVAGNTGPAHLAAAVGAAVVSLFAPVVPASRWAPFTDRLILLGDQQAGCAGSRARTCPIAGHPCLDSVTGAQVLAALNRLGLCRPAQPKMASVPETCVPEVVEA